MLVILQRVSESSIKINRITTAKIGKGLLILLGIAPEDTQADIEWLCKKIVHLRIFNDEAGKMNLSLLEINGEVLVVSQFTLFANTDKGNRPSFLGAAKPDVAIPLYEKFIQTLEKSLNKKIQTGEFGADMQVSLINDGPVTITINSKDKK